jgi:hypothetical protein
MSPLPTTGRKDSQLPIATSILNTDYFRGVVGGLSKRIPPDVLQAYFEANFNATAKLIGDVTRAPFNADPNGDDEAIDKINACAQFLFDEGGGELYLPGHFKISDSVMIPGGTLSNQSNVSIRGDGFVNSQLLCDEAAMRDKNVIACYNRDVIGGGYFKDFGIIGPRPATTPLYASIGIALGNMGFTLIEGVEVVGCNTGFLTEFSDNVVFNKCHQREANTTGLSIGRQGSGRAGGVFVINSLIQVNNPDGNCLGYPSNIAIGGAERVFLLNITVDEMGLNKPSGGASLFVLGESGGYVTTEVNIEGLRVFAPGTQTGLPYYGVRVGGGGDVGGLFHGKLHIKSAHIRPWVHSPERVSTKLLFIEDGSSGIVLEDVTTEVNTGAPDPTKFGAYDIYDGGLDTVWRNVNGVSNQRYTAAAYAGTINADASLSEFVRVAPLTAPVILANPTGLARYGQKVTYSLEQGGAGGYAVTLGNLFKFTFSNAGNAVGKRCCFTVVYTQDGLILDGVQGWQ